jgi:TonB family protein
MVPLLLLMGTGLGYADETTSSHVPSPLDKQETTNNLNPPIPLNNIEAHYSNEARKKGINGRCIVSLIVDIQGNPKDIRLVSCTNPVFENTSLEAVAKYKFSPATTKKEGSPVPVQLAVEVEYKLYGLSEWRKMLHYNFTPPPGVSATDSGADGVYPFTKDATPPIMSKFEDKGYGAATFHRVTGNGACDIVLTIDVRGKASDPKVAHCDQPEFEEPAVKSLLKSEYQPGFVNGKAVPMRVSIHLEYGGDAAK